MPSGVLPAARACATRPQCEGLDLIGRNRNPPGTRGLHMRSMLVVDGDGVPLGVPHVEYSAPDDATGKTGRWLRGLRAASALAGDAGDVRPLVAMDR